MSALLPTRTATVAIPAREPAHEPAHEASHVPSHEPGHENVPVGERIQRVPIDAIETNPEQPRRHFEQERLEELAHSIRAHGIIQPLVARRRGNALQLIAGERRLRAARLAGLREVPVIIQEIPDDRLLEVSLIENIQREDLNPIEAALAFDRLMQDFHLTAEEIGARTGKDRTTITNFVRLLQLPPEVQKLVADRRLSAGHARSLLALPTAALRKEVAERAAARGWSVRDTERETKRLTAPPDPKSPEAPMDPNMKAAIEELERVLGTKVRIAQKSTQQGHIEIEYYSSDDLNRLYTLILGERA